MPQYFARLKTGHPSRLAPPRDGPNSWKIYTILDDRYQWSCRARADIAALNSVEDQKKARGCLVQFQLNAAHGLPLQGMYDEKALHPIVKFNWNHHEYKIWRIRQGPIRVCFIYLNNKRILIIKILAKRKGELTDGETDSLKNFAIEILKQLAEVNFEKTEVTHPPHPIAT
jgi:hypothetical protein